MIASPMKAKIASGSHDTAGGWGGGRTKVGPSRILPDASNLRYQGPKPAPGSLALYQLSSRCRLPSTLSSMPRTLVSTGADPGSRFVAGPATLPLGSIRTKYGARPSPPSGPAEPGARLFADRRGPD